VVPKKCASPAHRASDGGAQTADQLGGPVDSTNSAAVIATQVAALRIVITPTAGRKFANPGRDVAGSKWLTHSSPESTRP
jgi:hypothetical protein